MNRGIDRRIDQRGTDRWTLYGRRRAQEPPRAASTNAALIDGHIPYQAPCCILIHAASTNAALIDGHLVARCDGQPITAAASTNAALIDGHELAVLEGGLCAMPHRPTRL